MPKYLDDEVDETPGVSAMAMVATGVASGAASWFGSAANFVSKSLYW